MFSLICVWINCWVKTGEAGDLRRHRGHYDVSVMAISLLRLTSPILSGWLPGNDREVWSPIYLYTWLRCSPETIPGAVGARGAIPGSTIGSHTEGMISHTVWSRKKINRMCQNWVQMVKSIESRFKNFTDITGKQVSFTDRQDNTKSKNAKYILKHTKWNSEIQYEEIQYTLAEKNIQNTTKGTGHNIDRLYP